MTPAGSGGNDPDELRALLGEPVAMALRAWAQPLRQLVGLPLRPWSASGYTGAVVTAIVLRQQRGDQAWGEQKLIIKVVPAGQEWETGLHQEAWRQNRSFAERHLVRQPYHPVPVGDGRVILFQEIAGDQFDCRPVDKVGAEQQAVWYAATARLVLTDWNGDRWPEHPTSTRAMVDDYLRHELRRPIGKIERWADENDLARPGAQWVAAPAADGGDRLPNPIAMVRSGLSARRVVVEYLYGLSHGDLHGGNILVPYRERPAPPDPEEIKIVDLAGFDPAAPLTRDLVALSLSAAAAEVEATSGVSEGEALLRLLLDGTGQPGSASLGPGRSVRAILRAAGRPGHSALEWRIQYLLSLQAGALAHASYKNHSDAARCWFFRLAARAAAEFLRLVAEQALAPAAGEAPERVIASLVSTGPDREAASMLRERLARHAEDHRRDWIVRFLLHKEELNESRDHAPHRPAVLVFLVSEQSLQDLRCWREIDAARYGEIPVIAVRADAKALSLDRLRDVPVVDSGDDGFDRLTQWITEISQLGPAGRQISEKLSRTEAAEEQADGLQRRRLAVFNRDQRVRLEDERRRVTGTGPRRPRPEPPDLTGETGQAREVRLVNEAPAVPQAEFRDRVPEMRTVEDAIADVSTRAVVVHGAVGSGKTAFASELRRRLAAPRPRAEVDAVVYLSAGGYRPITVATVLLDLMRCLPQGPGRARLGERLQDPIDGRAKLTEVLAALRGVAVVVILDAAEHLVTANGDVSDRDLPELLRELARRDGHAITLVLTVAGGPPPWIRRALPAARRVPLDRGLPIGDTIAFLSALDRTATVGLAALADDPDYWQRVYAASQGHPRTLELFVGLLRQDPGRSVLHLLDDLEHQATPEDAAERLFDWTFAKLDRTEQLVLQALAAYGRPVPPTAVDSVLEPWLAGIDSSPVLRGLHDRRIARHDHGHYYLPPAESDRIRAAMPAGEFDDHRRVPPRLTRYALLHRAAAYFEQARPAEITDLRDLRPVFSEIDLRVRARDYHRAFKIMNKVEDEYLVNWGQSDALLGWRRAVQGFVGNDTEEANNRRRLVAALQQQENIDDARTELLAARRDCSWLSAPRARITLNIQLANVHFDTGQFSRAGRLYRRHMWQCRLVRGMGRDRAVAQENLALCLARTGRHSRALRLFSTPLATARALAGPDRGRILPTLLANNAWVLGQVDQPGAALDLLREGCSVAAGRRDVGRGLCLSGEAAVLIDSGAAAQAVLPAEEAAEIGEFTRDGHLRRQANLNLALAHLCTGDRGGEAFGRAESSARLDRGPRAVGANGLLGIAAFRRGWTDRAQLAFLAATEAACHQVEREPDDYLAWDALGIAYFGLALIEVEQQSRRLADAGDAFAHARRITAAAGAVNRNTILLGIFGDRADGDLVAAMTAVARGAASPFGPPN